MLDKDVIKEYWDDRYSRQGERTVGFAGRSMEEQDKNYEERYKLIIPQLFFCLGDWLNKKAKNFKFLDYGCGIGRYSDFFDENFYLGVDVCQEALEFAKKKNPNHSFVQIPEGNLNSLNFNNHKFHVFMTNTVLQHCSDEVVNEILSSAKNHMERECMFAFYENCHPKEHLKHVAFRQPMDYMGMLSKHFDIRDAHVATHTIHGEIHAICLYKAFKK